MLAGCSADAPIATAPDARAGGADLEKAKPKRDKGRKGFYPLEVGNRWQYRHELRILLIPVAGPPVVLSARGQDVLRELVCVETRGELEYVVERETITEPGRTFVTWIRYRQDGSGLYEADVLGTEPPACDPAGSLRADRGRTALEPHAIDPDLASIADPERRRSYAAAIAEIEEKRAATRRVRRTDRSGAAARSAVDGELTRLRYPLRRNQSWTIRTDPEFTARVEGHESLALPVGRKSGWRVLLHSEFYGPRDFARFWYSRDGVLQFREGFEAEVRDPAGNPTGERIVGMGGETLVRFTLDRPERRAVEETAALP